MHLGVGIIIINENRDSCFVQIKDEHYPVEKYRNGLSFFGGKIEVGESPLEGLLRELEEEIDIKDLIPVLSIRFIQKFEIGQNPKFEFHFFEGILSQEEFNILTERKVFEGTGKSFPISSITNLNWIWGLEKVISEYSENRITY